MIGNRWKLIYYLHVSHSNLSLQEQKLQCQTYLSTFVFLFFVHLLREALYPYDIMINPEFCRIQSYNIKDPSQLIVLTNLNFLQLDLPYIFIYLPVSVTKYKKHIMREDKHRIILFCNILHAPSRKVGNIGNIERKLLIAGNFGHKTCYRKYVEEKLTSLQPG